MAETEIPKPHWCPQDVWQDTAIMFDALYDAEPDLEGGCELGIRSMTARAILAERERCAKVAEARIPLWEEAEAIASSIRSGAQHE